jgi:hypothetical protein
LPGAAPYPVVRYRYGPSEWAGFSRNQLAGAAWL